ncbi:tetratricopeptide-like helical domain, DYW domain protein, partial [Tanacetum coccineum]
TWKMFRSKATMEQHAKKYTQNKNNSTRMESHMQTIGNLHDDSHRPSSFSHTFFRPPFCSTIQQNCFPSSSSADFQSIRSNPTTYNPNLYDSMIHHSTSSSYSKPTTFEPMLHPSTSTLSDQPSSSRTSLHQFSSSFHLNQDDEDKDEDEDEDEIDEESKEVEIVAGVCTRFMTILLSKPNLCPPEAKDWREIKARCGTLLLGELRRKFSLPQVSDLDDVLFAMFGVKVRYTKHRFKMKLFRLAAKKLDESNNVGANGELERTYTDEAKLSSSPVGKLSQQGKKAKSMQVHTHTTGATSFARKRDRFKTKHKRSPNRMEFFDLSYQSRDGSYIHGMSKDFMEQELSFVKFGEVDDHVNGGYNNGGGRGTVEDVADTTTAVDVEDTTTMVDVMDTTTVVATTTMVDPTMVVDVVVVAKDA